MLDMAIPIDAKISRKLIVTKLPQGDSDPLQ